MTQGRQPAGSGPSLSIWYPALYFVLSAVWVAASDRLARHWAQDPATFERWSTYKGWGFVAVTALLFAWGIRRAQAAQREASRHLDTLEARARDLVESSPDAILIQEGMTIAYANPAAARLLGASGAAQLVGHRVLDFIDPADQASVEERSAAVVHERPFPSTLVRRMRRLDGAARRVEVALARFPGQGSPALQVTLHDVTQGWLLQEEVRRTTAALRTLSAVNEALVRAGTERELMEEVCRIAVDHGGYRLAWVALAPGGDPARLAKVASHGAGDEAMARVGLSWEVAVRSDGMPATALRTGQAVVVNDFAAESRDPDLRERLRQAGWLSAVALPMRQGGERLGTLTLLAGEVEAFDPPVVQLLQQLVDDLAFGLTALRTREVLASERGFLDAVLQNAGVLIGVADRNGVLVRANAEYERLTGWPVGELLGHLLWERVVAPERRSAYQRIFQAMWQGPFPVVAGGELLTRAGEIRNVEWVQSALHDAAGEPTFLVGIGHDVTERSQAEARLRESREQLRALAGRLQSVREEEKTRIARDLHDELGQLLTGLKMDLRWLERRLSDLPPSEAVNPLVDRVVAASELADQTVASVQRIAAELRPGALDRLGLVPALRQEVRRFQERTGISCLARLDDATPEPPPEVATALYRICQEALTNVSRHAGAGQVWVSLAAEPPGLVLRVEDDGRGLDATAPGPGALGLLGMTERATMLGGQVAFTRRPAGGTAVVASLPMAAAPTEAR